MAVTRLPRLRHSPGLSLRRPSAARLRQRPPIHPAPPSGRIRPRRTRPAPPPSGPARQPVRVQSDCRRPARLPPDCRRPTRARTPSNPASWPVHVVPRAGPARHGTDRRRISGAMILSTPRGGRRPQDGRPAGGAAARGGGDGSSRLAWLLCRKPRSLSPFPAAASLLIQSSEREAAGASRGTGEEGRPHRGSNIPRLAVERRVR